MTHKSLLMDFIRLTRKERAYQSKPSIQLTRLKAKAIELFFLYLFGWLHGFNMKTNSIDDSPAQPDKVAAERGN